MLLKRQESVTFDPSNPEHRACVAAFLKRNAWNDSPIRFRLEADSSGGSVADQVKAKLLQWYINNDDEVAVDPLPEKKVTAIINATFLDR